MNKKEHNTLDIILAVILALVVPVGGYIGWKLEENKITKVPKSNTKQEVKETKEVEAKEWIYWETYRTSDGGTLTRYDPQSMTYNECTSKLKNSTTSNSYGCGQFCRAEGQKLDCSKYCSKLNDMVSCGDTWNSVMLIRLRENNL